MLADDELIKTARRKHLRYISSSMPGIRRTKKGDEFKYFDPNGITIYNKNTLERIKTLNIPPAWRDVWISPLEDSHLQATGFDDKDRKQYIYHEDWVALSSENKFEKLLDFANVLPIIRQKVSSSLKLDPLSKKRVLATIIWLLEHTFIRVGNDEYAKDNKSYGLTTLRGKHVKVTGPQIKFEFKGKSGVPHLVHISHPSVAKTIKECIELPGYEIFKCIDENGNKHIIDSADVNEFLQDISGKGITAKEFRTWGGTVLAAVNFNMLGHAETITQEAKNITQTVKEVAKHLRNTPTVCKKYYIHPTVITTYTKKILIPHFQLNLNEKLNFMSPNEYKVVTLLQKYS